MRSPAHTRVKVCCMKSIDEVWMAIEAGASAIGLVSPMPSGPGPISNEKAAEIAAEVPPGIDAFLLTPIQTVEELGGTGRRHDWAISRRIREAVGVPMWLAGGLNPDNAREAIETVRPFALDLCSGIRSGEGYDLDPDKLDGFMAAVRETDASGR